MKIQPLYDLQQEINRLFIAGSKFAAGDPRLLKQVPVFTKLGEKAPVFKKLAADIEDLTKSNSQQSSEKLLAISTLLYSILYTQGEATEEGAVPTDRKPGLDINEIETENSYLQLKPVISALTSSAQGRLEVLTDAFTRKVFNDFRTFKHLDNALADKYGELADYVANIIIPSVGAPIIPYILSGFAYEDKSEHVRRVSALKQLNYTGLPEMAEKILSENLPKLQAEIITYLANDLKNEELISKLADDKIKGVREAAYNALALFNTEKSLEKLKDLYLKGKHTEGVVHALSLTPLPFYFEEVLAQFNQGLDHLKSLTKDSNEKDIIAAVNRIGAEVNIFTKKDRAEVYEIFEYLLLDKQIADLIKAKKGVLGYTPSNITNNIVQALHSFEPAKTLDFLNKVIPKLNNADWQTDLYRQQLHYAAKQGYSKEQLYDLFAEPFKKGYINLNDWHYQIFGNNYNYYYNQHTHTSRRDIVDERWLPVFYEVVEKSTGKDKWYYEGRTALMLLDACEPADSKKLNEVLLKVMDKYSPNEIDFIYEILVKRNVPDRFELILNSLSKLKKGSYYYSYNAHRDYWKKFPKEYAEKIRQLYEKTNITSLAEIADIIEEQ